MRGRPVLVAVVSVLALAACDPFGLPSTRALENGAVATLTSARSFEMAGTYAAGGSTWSVDLEIAGVTGERIVASDGKDSVEAIVIGHAAYFRGRDFLAAHVTDPRSKPLISAAGDAWWTGVATDLPGLPDLTAGEAFRSAFLGPAVATRTDHRTVGGVDAVELSGGRADVYIASTPPYELLRVHLRNGVTVDGITQADFVYRRVNADFGIAPPSPVIDFGNLSTLPPLYTVETVDISRCAATCAVTATVRNLGGGSGAAAPSTVTFTMTDAVSHTTLRSCTAVIQPDVGYNQTATVSCTMPGAAVNAAVITAAATNPGRG